MLATSRAALLDLTDDAVRGGAYPSVRLVHAAHGPNHGAVRVEKSFRLNEKFFDAEAHKQLIADALRRRFAPGTGYYIKQVAYAIRVKERDIYNWMNGNNAPSALNIANLGAFFGESFNYEVYGDRWNWMRRRHNHDIQRVLTEALKMVGGE